jgi:Tfp pilus assembly protein PilV
MKIVRIGARRCAGASLLEVLVAVALLAVSLLGVAAMQLSALGDAQVQTHRARASWMAASMAEAMALPELSSLVLARLRRYASVELPAAHISIVDDTAGVGAVTVRWASARNTLQQRQSAGDGCSLADGLGAADCIALPFASGE